MKQFDYAFTDEFGEVHQIEIRYKANWESNGYNYYKNGNFKQYVPDVEFALNGVNVCPNNCEEACELGMAMDRLSNDTERAFNKSHPELNP